jgi:ATP-dependent Lhr-like helicase
VDGLAAGYLRRGERDLLLAVPDEEPRRSHVARAVVRALTGLASARPEGRRGLHIETINGTRATQHPGARWLIEEGFTATADGLQYRVPRSHAPAVADGRA